MSPEAVMIPDWDDLGPWEVSTSPVGDCVHVSPLKSFSEMNNWQMFAGRWRISYLWRSFGICSWRRVYPRTEKQLAKAIRDCQRFCDRENAKEARGRELGAVAVTQKGKTQ